MLPDIRDEIVDCLGRLKKRTGLPFSKLLQGLGLSSQKLSEWRKVYGQERKIRQLPKSSYVLPQEREAIIAFKKEHMSCRLPLFKLDDDRP